MWGLRKKFWNGLATRKFASNRPALIPVPVDGARRLNAVSLGSQFPGIPIPNIRVADRVPDDEAQPLKYYFYKFQVAMYTILPANQSGLPPIDADPLKALDNAYTDAHRKLFPLPALPEEYRNGFDLGRIAVASPYACYVERAPEGGYQWDLRQLDKYEHHSGLHSIGARVLFRLNPGATLQRGAPCCRCCLRNGDTQQLSAHPSPATTALAAYIWNAVQQSDCHQRTDVARRRL